MLLMNEKLYRSWRILTDKYNCDKGQIQNIIKRKSDVLKSYEEFRSSKRKRLTIKTKHQEINNLTMELFEKAWIKNIPSSGPLIQAKVVWFAENFGDIGFTDSIEGLESFRKQNNIFLVYCLEKKVMLILKSYMAGRKN